MSPSGPWARAPEASAEPPRRRPSPNVLIILIDASSADDHELAARDLSGRIRAGRCEHIEVQPRSHLQSLASQQREGQVTREGGGAEVLQVGPRPGDLLNEG